MHDSLVGKTLAHFQILEPLGEGGMAVVYRARDTHLERDVAIKILTTSLLTDEEGRRRFRLEAHALSTLRHPHIAIVHDFDSQGGVDFLVMELMDGGTLAEVVAHGPLPDAEVVRYAIAIASALECAHAQGIVHRDLKPGNILRSADGNVKVADFGIAKWLGPDEESAVRTRTQLGGVLGTLAYMAPEQLRGEPVDHRTDLYALGVVIYEMCAGRLPFEQTLATALVGEILHEPLPPPSRWNPKVSPRLEAIVTRLLERDPAARYPTARAVIDDLTQLERPDPGRAATMRAPARLPRKRVGWVPAAVAGAALAILTVALVGPLRNTFQINLGGTTIRSLAVLPVVDLSHSPDEEYFAEGMTDELITRLAQIRALKVISRTSVMRYRGSDRPLPEIARALQVDAVIAGSVRRSGNRVRISAQLIRARTQQILWSQSYEQEIRDVLSIQDEIARAIAQEIRVRLTPEESAALGASRAVQPDAYQLYLKGRFLWNKRTPDGIRDGLARFKEALDLDPGYARAYAGIADSYSMLGNFGLLSPQEAYPRAKEAARRGLGLDSTLAEAHASLARVEFEYDWNPVVAERGFRTALKLNPNYATAHQWYGLCLAAMSRFDESIAEMRRAQELDPLSPSIRASLAWSYYFAKRNDEAIAQLRRTLDLEPGFMPAHALLDLVYRRKGMHAEAIAETQRRMTLQGDSAAAVELGRTFARSGYPATLRWQLQRWEAEAKKSYFPATDIATWYAMLGDRKQAIAWLDKAVANHEQALAYLRSDPEFDVLRKDAAFAALLGRVAPAPEFAPLPAP